MPVDKDINRCSTFFIGLDNEKREIVDYFYKVAKENGFTSLLYDPRCKTKEEVDEYIEYLIDMHK